MYSSLSVCVKRSVSIVTHKLIEMNKTYMEVILKPLSTVMNENRRNKVFSVLKQLKYNKDTHFSLNHVHLIFISTFPLRLTSCILNIVDTVNVTSKQHVNITEMFRCLT